MVEPPAPPTTPSPSGHSSGYDVHHLVASQLAASEQRYTDNRRQLVDILVDTEGPVTIADILDQGEDLAQSSAYRNLVVLEEAGVVHRIITSDDHARFELTEAVTGHHHHHLVLRGEQIFPFGNA